MTSGVGGVKQVRVIIQSVKAQVNRLDPSNPLPLFSQRNGWHCHSRKAFRMEKWVNGQCQPNLENSLRTLK